MTDEELRHHLSTPPDRDPGFTLRVLAALPRRRIAPRTRLLWLLTVSALAAAIVFITLGRAGALANLPDGPILGLGTWPLLAGILALLALATTALAVASEALD